MSETQKRLRLTDDEVKRWTEDLRCPPMIGDDHLQAREDRKLLANLARRVTEETHDTPESPHCPKCLAETALAALAREVDP